MQTIHRSAYRPHSFVDVTGFQSNLQRSVLCIDSRDRALCQSSRSITSITTPAGLVNGKASAAKTTAVPPPISVVDTGATAPTLSYNASPSTYKISFPAFFRVRKIRLLTTEMPNAQQVINATNNQFDIIDSSDGKTRTFTVPPGSYTGATLAAAIQTLLVAQYGAVYTVSFNTDTSLITITRSGGPTFQLPVASGPSTANGTAIWFNLGFDTFPAVDVASTATTTSPGIVKLFGENYIYMKINTLSSLRTSDANDANNIFAKIILDVPPGFVSFNNFVSNDFEWINAKDQLREVEVSFLNHDGTLYNFMNCNHSFTLELLHERA